MELKLISASSTRKEPADCTLVYRLDDETAAQGLPVVRETHPWAGNAISALRDRLMIEWVLSFSESKKLLGKMVDEITTTVQKQKSSGCGAVCVGVVCSDGAQLSPCFVEKLYDHFSFGPGRVEGLRVSRSHLHALKGGWRHSKDTVWQVSSVRVHEKVQSHLTQVLKPRMWFSFDSADNSTCEHQFSKDPFSSNVHIPHMDLRVDFESGTAYNSWRGKTYYIRCSRVAGKTVKSWPLTDSGYKSASRSFRAAGIQPYSVHPVTGEAVFLLGRITYSTGDWCDFGGLRSWVDRERPRTTAARECSEETLEVLGSTKELMTALADFKTNNCFKVLNQDTHYVEHFVRVPYQDYPGTFERVLRSGQEEHVEVDELKWFSLTSLKSAVKVACSEGCGTRLDNITVNAIQEDGTVDALPYHLRAPFVSTLCIADSLNFLESIAGIARHLHRKQRSSEATSLATASATVLIASEDPEMVEPPTVTESDGGSESGSERSDTDETSDTNAPVLEETKQLSASSSHENLAEVQTNKVLPNPEQGHELDDEESRVRAKPLAKISSTIRQKRRGKHCPKRSHQHPDSGAKCKSRRHKQLCLYGMGAGSFPFEEI